MKHSYNVDFKLEVLKYATESSTEKAAKKFNLSTSTIRGWKKQKKKLGNIILGSDVETLVKQKDGNRKRLTGAGGKLKNLELEEFLVTWIQDTRNEGHAVSRNMIMRKATDAFRTFEDSASSTFNASRGWLEKFLKRNNFSLRRRTTVAQKDPEQLADKIASYIAYVSSIRKKHLIRPENIVAMDETPIYFDSVANTTVNERGVKTITVKSTGHEKDKVTVCLAAKGDGKKLEPFIVFKKASREVKKMQTEKKTPGVEIASHPNGSMDDVLTKQWLDKVFTKLSFGTRMLVWDSFRGHISKSTKEHIREFNVKMAVVPGGTTKYIQAPDVSWNKPFKANFQEQYHKWMMDGNMELTKGGNLRAPGRALIVQWVTKAWDDLPQQLILDSFKYCALTTSTSGSEDHLIHCIKPGEPCRAAWSILQNCRDDENETFVYEIEDAADASDEECDVHSLRNGEEKSDEDDEESDEDEEKSDAESLKYKSVFSDSEADSDSGALSQNIF